MLQGKQITDPTQLRQCITLPVKTDEMGIYVWDAERHMVMDSHRDDADQTLRAFAMALNAANGYPEQKEKALEALKLSGVQLPVKAGGDLGIEILDARNVVVIRTRGWGRLQYHGEKIGIAAQQTICQAFVDAMNALQV